VTRGRVGGRYRLEEQLGVGGMSEVWAAEDVELGRRVAIKLLGSDADPARFDREARAVAALGHPNICQLYDYGEEDGRPFMVLEYLGGGTLEERLIPRERYADAETRRLALELAAALAHAHERGVVHRDLKPANVLFDDEGRAKIADFGIARLGGAGTLTEAGTLLGTAAYISPEQATGQPATPASDVYSFGVILYRLLTGRLPFEAEDALKLAAMHVNERPAPIRADPGGAAADLAALAEAALAKAPEARPADGAALVAALSEGGEAPASAGTPLVPPTEATIVIPQTRRPRWPPQRRPVGAAPMIVAAVLALAAGGVALAVLAGPGSNTSGPTAPSHRGSQTHSVSATTTQAAPPATTAPTTAPATTPPSTTVAPPPPTPPPPTPPPPPTTAPTTVSTTTPPVTTT
jgi:eukaryotic-like serine/threonine-protein kinase